MNWQEEIHLTIFTYSIIYNILAYDLVEQYNILYHCFLYIVTWRVKRYGEYEISLKIGEVVTESDATIYFLYVAIMLILNKMYFWNELLIFHIMY